MTAPARTIGFRASGYADARAALLAALVAERPGGAAEPPLARLQVDDPGDWLVALCDAWASLAEIVGFYQDRIANEAYLPTATDPDALDRLAASLGRPVAPHTAAATTVAYHLTGKAAGVEAIARARAGAGTRTRPLQAPGRRTTVPAAAQVRALPGPGSAPPTFVTQEALDAVVGASRLGVQFGATGAIAQLRATTTRLELAGERTGLAVGQPLLIVATDGATTQELSWVRLLTSVDVDRARGCTRVGWDTPLAASLPGGFPTSVQDPLVYGFGARSGLAGAAAPAWGSLTTAAQLAAPLAGVDGAAPVRGGLAQSTDGGTTWAPVALPAPGMTPTCAQAFDGLLVVGVGRDGLLRQGAEDPAPVPAQVSGARRPITFVGGTRQQLLAGGASGTVYTSVDDGRTWSVVTGGPPTLVSGSAAREHASTLTTPLGAAGTPRVPVPASPQVELAVAAPTPRTGRRRRGLGAKQDDGVVSVLAGNQLPSATVRWVLQDGAGELLAATDAGVYRYAAGVWTPDGLADPAFMMLSLADVDPALAVPASAAGLILAATAAGVALRGAVAPPVSNVAGAQPRPAAWQACGTLKGRAYALAVAAPPTGAAGPLLYAATDAGVFAAALPAGDDAAAAAAVTWTALPAIPDPSTAAALAVTALTATPGGAGLIAGTAAGPYAWTPATAAWTRCDRLDAFTVPDAALDGVSTRPAPPPPGLVVAFSARGIVLNPTARLAPADDGKGGYVLNTGPTDTYAIDPGASAGAPWAVRLVAALGQVTALSCGAGTILAAAGAVAPLATDWPGAVVAGPWLELSPPVRALPPASRAVIEQRTEATVRTHALQVAAVEQDTEQRFGTLTSLTRIEVGDVLDPRTFPRRASAVWSQSVPLPLFVGPPATVPVVDGDDLLLAGEVDATLPAGRLVAVGGRPIGLTVAPLGGLLRTGRDGATSHVAAAQLSVADVAVDAGGAVYAATDQGVCVLVPGGAQPPTVLGTDGAAAGLPTATAVVALAAGGPDGTVLAALPGIGVRRRTSGATTWAAAGLGDAAVALLAADGATALAATPTGAVHACASPGDDEPTWTTLAPPGAPLIALAAGAGTVLAATADGILATATAGAGAATVWRALPAGAVPTGPRALAVDHHGTAWCGTAEGLSSLPAGAAAWDVATAFDAPVTALAIAPDGDLLAASAGGLWRRAADGGAWTAVPGNPAAPVTALAEGGDGTLWLGLPAELPLARPAAATGRATALAHVPVFTGIGIDAGDVETLDQGGLPTAVVQAFADHRQPVDARTVVVTAAGADGVWCARSGPDLTILVARHQSTAQTVDAYRTQGVAHALGTPTDGPGGATQSWPVLLGDDPATLLARTATIVQLAAAPDAPALSETATLAKPSAGAELPVAAGAATRVRLAQALRHVYDASTVQVDLNVVGAVQGRPVSVPLGSGDPRVAHQRFAVPTPVAVVPQPSGQPATSLVVTVDGTPWTILPSLLAAGPGERACCLRTRADGTVTVCFGDGVHGARLPAGRDNVVAGYLQGGGAAGEVAPGVLIQPLDRPQLVTAVQNPTPALRPPMPAAGASATAAVRGLGRVVTLADLEDWALAQAQVDAATAELVAGPAGRDLVVSLSGGASPAGIARALAAVAGPGPAVRVLAATVVGVVVTVELAATRPPAPAAVKAALQGIAARRPGAPLRAADVLARAGAIDGVVGARILGWKRARGRLSTAPDLPARGARWGADGSLRGAELLVVDDVLLAPAVAAGGAT